MKNEVLINLIGDLKSNAGVDKDLINKQIDAAKEKYSTNANEVEHTTNVGFGSAAPARNWFSTVCGTYDDQGGICEFVEGIDRYKSSERGGYRCYGG